MGGKRERGGAGLRPLVLDDTFAGTVLRRQTTLSQRPRAPQAPRDPLREAQLTIGRRGSFAVFAGVLLFAAEQVQAAGTIRAGVLHSPWGTMATSESSLKAVALMPFEEINAKGGILAMKIEPV